MVAYIILTRFYTYTVPANNSILHAISTVYSNIQKTQTCRMGNTVGKSRINREQSEIKRNRIERETMHCEKVIIEMNFCTKIEENRSKITT